MFCPSLCSSPLTSHQHTQHTGHFKDYRITVQLAPENPPLHPNPRDPQAGGRHYPLDTDHSPQSALRDLVDRDEGAGPLICNANSSAAISPPPPPHVSDFVPILAGEMISCALWCVYKGRMSLCVLLLFFPLFWYSFHFAIHRTS